MNVQDRVVARQVRALMPTPSEMKACRLAAHMTTQDMADFITGFCDPDDKVSRQGLAHWEAGRRVPRLRYVLPIISALNVLAVIIEDAVPTMTEVAGTDEADGADIGGVEQAEVAEVGGVEQAEVAEVGGVEQAEVAEVGGVEQAEVAEVGGVEQAEVAEVGGVEQAEVAEVGGVERPQHDHSAGGEPSGRRG